jgi:hypothetical protein
MPGKKPPFTHREMAKLMFTPSPHEKRISIIPTWLKVEAYTLFFTVLPYLITLVIWIAIIAAGFWAVTLI